MQCNVCRCREFVEFRGRGEICCARCKSIERTRLLWMYLEKFPVNGQTKILHLAPERGIYKRLRKMTAPENYVVCDFQPERYPFAKDCRKIDLCDLDAWPSDEFDLILHSHVMEHVPCNYAYSLFHLHRMLKPTGRHICVIPFMPGKYDESLQDIPDEERKRRFGQADHLRRFGRDDVGRHLGKVLNLPEQYDASRDFPEEALRYANIPESAWRGLTFNTVLVLEKNDMRLLPPVSGADGWFRSVFGRVQAKG